MIDKIPARAVLYSNDLEPLTVIELSESDRAKLMDYGCLLRETQSWPSRGLAVDCIRIVAEKIVRGGRESFMLFTPDRGNAMRLPLTLLPGQQRAME